MEWKTFRVHIQDGITENGLHTIRRAFVLVDYAHDGELRDGGKPYKDHPIEATLDGYDIGERDPETLAATVAHDVLESARKLGRPLTLENLEKKTDVATACRISWMTKEGHDMFSRSDHWKNFLACKDRKTFKAKCYDRLNNVKSFDDMKPKGKESKERRIKRKVTETVEVFSRVLAWLEADVEVRSFKTKAERDAERHLIANIRKAFNEGLAPYGARLR